MLFVVRCLSFVIRCRLLLVVVVWCRRCRWLCVVVCCSLSLFVDCWLFSVVVYCSYLLLAC